MDVSLASEFPENFVPLLGGVSMSVFIIVSFVQEYSQEHRSFPVLIIDFFLKGNLEGPKPQSSFFQGQVC